MMPSWKILASMLPSLKLRLSIVSEGVDDREKFWSASLPSSGVECRCVKAFDVGVGGRNISDVLSVWNGLYSEVCCMISGWNILCSGGCGMLWAGKVFCVGVLSDWKGPCSVVGAGVDWSSSIVDISRSRWPLFKMSSRSLSKFGSAANFRFLNKVHCRIVSFRDV